MTVKVIDENGNVYWVPREVLRLASESRASGGERHVHLHIHVHLHGLEALLGAAAPSPPAGGRRRAGVQLAGYDLGYGYKAPGYGLAYAPGYRMAYGTMAYGMGYGYIAAPRKKRAVKKRPRKKRR